MAELELVLLRHGIAEPRGRGVEDRQRALTPEGRLRTQSVCQRACQLGLRAGALVSSPLVRARQTGEIAVAAGLAPSLACNEALAPGGDPWPMLQALWATSEGGFPRRLILVGHEPDLGQLACRLLGAPPGAVVLKKAGIALLSWAEASLAGQERGSAQLLLLLTPKVLIPSDAHPPGSK